MADNDGYKTMLHCSRFLPPFKTTFMDNAYWYCYPIHTSKGGQSAWIGPYTTRQEAKSNA